FDVCSSDLITFACIWGLASASVVEIDIMVASDLPDFRNPANEAVLEQSGRSVFLHEMGHAHGLQHDQDYLNVMGDARFLPFAGGTGTRAVLFPDDSAGLRA